MPIGNVDFEAGNKLFKNVCMWPEGGAVLKDSGAL